MGNVQAFFARWGWFLIIGAGVFLGAYILFGRKQKQAATTSTNVLAGQSTQNGANGQPVVEYLPTTGDSYTNVNYTSQVNSNNPSINNSHTSDQTTNNNTTGSVVNSPGGTVNPTPPPAAPLPQPPTVPPPTPVVQPPHPPQPPSNPAPPPANPFKQYTIVHGDTLSAIAGRFHTTWQNLYNINKGVVDQWAAAHNSPIPGGPWNNIFPGEQIQVPA